MRKLFAVIIAVLTFVFLLTSCGQADEPAATEDGNEAYVLSTRYADLTLPAEWEEELKITVDDGDVCEVSFASADDKIPIFDLVFNSDKGSPLGTLHTLDGDIRVGAVFYEIDSKAPDYEKLVAVQDDINIIISDLTDNYDFDTSVSETPKSEEVFEIETDIVSLYYPKKWQDIVTVNPDKDNEEVKFSYKDIPLFTIAFDGDAGTAVGKYNGKTIYLISYEPDTDSMEPDEADTVFAMMDDVNVILEYLGKEKGFEQ